MNLAPTTKSLSLKRSSQGSLMYAVILVITIILLGWFVFLPKLSDVSAAKEKRQQAEAGLENIDQDTQLLNKLVAQMRDSSKEVALLDEALPLDSRLSKFELLVANVVGSSGMKLVNITAAPQVAESSKTISTPTDVASGNKQLLAQPFKAVRQLKTMPISLTVSGTMDQFKGLLRLMETSSRIMDVENFDLSQDRDGLVTFRLKLKAYSYAP